MVVKITGSNFEGVKVLADVTAENWGELTDLIREEHGAILEDMKASANIDGKAVDLESYTTFGDINSLRVYLTPSKNKSGLI